VIRGELSDDLNNEIKHSKFWVHDEEMLCLEVAELLARIFVLMAWIQLEIRTSH